MALYSRCNSHATRRKHPYVDRPPLQRRGRARLGWSMCAYRRGNTVALHGATVALQQYCDTSASHKGDARSGRSDR